MVKWTSCPERSGVGDWMVQPVASDEQISSGSSTEGRMRVDLNAAPRSLPSKKFMVPRFVRV